MGGIIFLAVAISVLVSGISVVYGEVPVTVTTDKSIYYDDETIIISGEVSQKELGNKISFTISSPSRDILFTKELEINSENKFETKLTTNTPLWNEIGTGKYTITVTHGDSNTAETIIFYSGKDTVKPNNFPPTSEDFLPETKNYFSVSKGEMIISNTDSFARYVANNASLHEVETNEAKTTLKISIEARDDGNLSVVIPYDLILMDISKGKHIVTVDGEPTDKYEISSDIGNYHTFDIEFPAGSKIIELFTNDRSAPSSIVMKGEKGCILDSYNHPQVILDSLDLDILHSDQTVTFTGRLICENGYKHSDVEIKIFENNLLTSERILVTAFTDTNGEFRAPWKVSADNLSEYLSVIQAKYEIPSSESGGHFEPASEKQLIQIKTELSGIILDPIPAAVSVGDTVIFSGQLELSSGDPEGYIVHIKDQDHFDEDDLLATAYVERDGSFSANWIATNTDADNTVDAYAVFEGAGIYTSIATCDQDKINSIETICPNTIPIQITGKSLTLRTSLIGPFDSDNDGISDTVDQCKFQLETYNGYLDWDGCEDTLQKFSLNFDTDEDGKNDNYDSCPSLPETFNGYYDNDGCPDTIPTSRPAENLMGDEYIPLYFSRSFENNPVIALVPAPDSYSDLAKYVIPSQEGISLWGSELTREFGGDWNVDFMIINPDSTKFSVKPDVIVNIVTRDQEINCDLEHGGDAYIPKWVGNNISSSLKTPVNLVICSNNFGLFKLTSEVSASATHEFIHYLGLGHAFNKPNDFLCSIEKEGPTCSNVSFKSDSPSHFDLSGIKTLYFEDGWKSPNMAIYSSDEKFTAVQYMNFVTVDKPDIVSQTVPVEYYSDSAYFDETLYSDSHASVKNPSNLLPPLQQISRGVSSTDVICQNNFQKLYKPNGDPACISEKNLEKFTAKGWIR